MRLGLGNNLVKTAFPIGTSPSLDLAFALDRSFTTDPAAAGNALITSRRGPSAKFSRGSGATQVNAAGLIEYAPENLILRSEEFDNSGWTKLRASVDDDATTSPTGTLTADKLIEDSSTGSHMTYRITALTSLVPHTFSVYAKADGRNFMYLQCGDGFPLNCHAYFDLSAGTKGTVGANATANIEPAGNGWYRCSVTATPTSLATNAFYIQPTAVNGSTTYTGDGTSGIFLWGAQLERASTARTYYPTTTSVFYGPRFDHDPATLASKGLLIEEPRTNLITNSGNASLWVQSNGTVDNLGFVSSPDGTVSGWNAGIGQANLNTSSANIVAGAYTSSVFLKRGNTDWIRVQFVYGVNVANANAWFNLATGQAGVAVVGIAGLTNVSSTITPYGNGWYRCTLTATTPGNLQSYFSLISAPSDNNVTRVTGSTYNIWGGQIETGAFATSYIPTTSGTLQRSADVCSIIGADFSSFYNQSEGTLFGRYSVVAGFSVTGRTIPVCAISNQSYNEAIRMGSPTSNLNMAFDTVASGTQTRILATSPVSLIGSNTAAGAYKISDSGFSNNSATTLSGSPASITTLVNRFDIGGLHPGSGALPLNGHIARIQYFRKRLSNAKLQTLTAP